MPTEFIKVFCNLFICLRTDLYIHYSVHALFFFAFSYYVSLRSEFCVVMYVTISANKRCLVRACIQLLVCASCVCFCTVVSNTYRVMFLFCFSSFCVPCAARSSGLAFLMVPSAVSNVYFNTQKLQCKLHV